MTDDVVQKLEDAFVNAMSDEQACAYAGIVKQTLYNYQEENPEFLDRKQQLKLRPDIKAKQTIVNSLGEPSHAWKWLERRDQDFKPVSKVEHAGSVDINDSMDKMSDQEKIGLKAFREARRKRIEEESKKLDD